MSITRNMQEYLSNIRVPQLVLQGQNDQYFATAQVDSIVKHSGGTVAAHLLADCAHCPYKEQTEQSFALINNFIGAHFRLNTNVG